MKRTHLALNFIKPRETREGKKVLVELGKRLDIETIRIILKLHPIVVQETGKGSFRLVAGEDQYRLARTVLSEQEKVTVKLIEDEDDSDLIALTDQLISPLVLGQALDEMTLRAEKAIEKKSVKQLGRNLGDMRQWRQLIDTTKSSKRAYRKPTSDESGDSVPSCASDIDEKDNLSQAITGFPVTGD
jgi:hypothetical protein